MAGETNLTLCGRLTSDPELKFLNSGHAIATFTVASNARTFNKQRNEWVDSDPMFLTCTAWRQLAENVAESLTKGMAIVVTGRLKSRSYETRDGQKRTVFEVDVEDCGPSLKFASATVQRQQRSGGQQSRQQSQGGPWASGGQGGRDPWQAQQGPDDKPPF